MSKNSNVSKGRDSYDITTGNTLVAFFNRNISTFSTEAGGIKFDLVPVEKQKDIMLNVARMHAEQEYNRIMELVKVLQQQAAEIKNRLDLTDMVHSAKYDYQLVHGNTYWIVYDHRKQHTILLSTGPNGWSTGPLPEWEYLRAVKWLGDHTWIEVKEDTNGNI